VAGHGGAGVGRHELGRGPGADVDPVGPAAGGEADVGASVNSDRDARGREAVAGKGDADLSAGDPVAPRAPSSGGAGRREIGGGREMVGIGDTVRKDGRLEGTGIVAPHDLSAGDGCQIGRPLMLAPRSERLAEAEEDEVPASRTASRRGRATRLGQTGVLAGS
jgi:hypothetical protein